ncbi:hypothetical protein EYF80_049790 [Liparis tanakae]|uniref:Uncharacterized protein n=1 Tax=Liparis tanakae TaxID=230148 RepID=A0A4Z2FGM8_9TELE|nr:hypothetical protein EYF80_049790 [Liparis tanakae]
MMQQRRKSKTWGEKGRNAKREAKRLQPEEAAGVNVFVASAPWKPSAAADAVESAGARCPFDAAAAPLNDRLEAPGCHRHRPIKTAN